MKVRYLETENTPLRYVEAGTVCEVDDEKAVELLESGMAEAVIEESERAVAKPARKAVKK